jgi:AAA+ ATPase superfamily predicted ATPase
MDRLAEVKRRAQRLQEAAKSLVDYVEASMTEIGEEERQRKRARSQSPPAPPPPPPDPFAQS